MASHELPFGTALIGQTENTLQAILRTLLAPHEMTQPQWIALNVLAARDGTSPNEARAVIQGVLKVSDEDSATLLAQLTQADFLIDGTHVELTPQARELLHTVRASIAEITGRLWADLPKADTDAAARVLNATLERGIRELAAAQAV